MEQLQDNIYIQEFLRLLLENQPERRPDYAIMLWQMDGMARQLEEALKEMQELKQQIGQMQKEPEGNFISYAVEETEKRLHTAGERLTDIRERILEGARNAVEEFKSLGVQALDKAVSALGIKKALKYIQADLGKSIARVGKSIEKVEAAGHELRSVGGHLKNAGRAALGKEREAVDGGREGSFQKAVLAPMRAEKKALKKMEDMAFGALGCLERLEESVERGKKKQDLGKTGRAQEEKENREKVGKKPEVDKKEKVSVLRDLEEKKARSSAYPVPVPGKERGLKEAAL